MARLGQFELASGRGAITALIALLSLTAVLWLIQVPKWRLSDVYTDKAAPVASGTYLGQPISPGRFGLSWIGIRLATYKAPLDGRVELRLLSGDNRPGSLEEVLRRTLAVKTIPGKEIKDNQLYHWRFNPAGWNRAHYLMVGRLDGRQPFAVWLTRSRLDSRWSSADRITVNTNGDLNGAEVTAGLSMKAGLVAEESLLGLAWRLGFWPVIGLFALLTGLIAAFGDDQPGQEKEPLTGPTRKLGKLVLIIAMLMAVFNALANLGCYHESTRKWDQWAGHVYELNQNAINSLAPSPWRYRILDPTLTRLASDILVGSDRIKAFITGRAAVIFLFSAAFVWCVFIWHRLTLPPVYAVFGAALAWTSLSNFTPDRLLLAVFLIWAMYLIDCGRTAHIPLIITFAALTRELALLIPIYYVCRHGADLFRKRTRPAAIVLARAAYFSILCAGVLLSLRWIYGRVEFVDSLTWLWEANIEPANLTQTLINLWLWLGPFWLLVFWPQAKWNGLLISLLGLTAIHVGAILIWGKWVELPGMLAMIFPAIAYFGLKNLMTLINRMIPTAESPVCGNTAI